MKRSIGLLFPPGFQALDLMATTVFELANNLSDETHYEVTMLSEHGGPVTSSSGVSVLTEPVARHDYDTLLVAGQMLPGKKPSSPGFIEILRQAGRQARRVASICTGAFLLAEAGLLDGKRATTHWQLARDLQRAYPKLRVEEDRIFINEGKIWTSAGMTACVDLCLAMVESDLGVDLARNIARQLVVYHRRSGGQSQFSALLELEPKSDRIQQALSYAKQHLRKPLSVDELAEAANLSTRQFSRTFRIETGQSPARAVEVLRVEAARAMIESSNHSIDVVARETGFADPERMRRAFLRAFGQPPQAIKRAAREQAAMTASYA
ncbi:GlxA family transcriptional regulator [Massilia sp. YIM B02763]|uniref:GlxA family transcriptional regulator n=1 Tax=Massilia sp. YIM B02763 TaxID=3050130 RepID=UPI0025B6C345|nr:GlxA family transcriptional regulator [Massilia sp. YIM B02763]MDN4056001.1 GlxA family transcriptional regulator [Massilia sp. YIM B02763]